MSKQNDKIAVRKLAEETLHEINLLDAEPAEWEVYVGVIESALLSVRPSPLSVSREDAGRKLYEIECLKRGQIDGCADLKSGWTALSTWKHVLYCDMAEAFAASIQAVKEEKVCEWRREHKNRQEYQTSCQVRAVQSLTPSQFGWKHCPFCSGRIKEVV